MNAAPRRCLTITGYTVGFMAMTALAPAWLPIALVVGLLRRRHFIIVRLLLFLWLYLGAEMLGLLGTLVVVLRTRRESPERDDQLFDLQCWWGSLLFRAATRLLRLNWQVEGGDVAVPGPVVVFMRHASIVDTLLPVVLLSTKHNLKLRYVLKRELLIDPCLDIVGHGLKNYFVDRAGMTNNELEGVRALVENVGKDGILIYPEGTRFTEEKRRRALEKLKEEHPDRFARSAAMRFVLPPRPGGVLTLLSSTVETDCMFLAHHGLEGAATIRDLMSGRFVGNTVYVKLWRVPSTSVPDNKDEQLAWFYEQWSHVNGFISSAMSRER